MKKLLLILLLMPVLCFSQKIQRKGASEVLELKECVTNYCSLNMVGAIGTVSPMVGVTEGDVWYFMDEAGKKKKFRSVVEVLNFMFDNGWIYLSTVKDEIAAGSTLYIFEKKR